MCVFVVSLALAVLRARCYSAGWTKTATPAQFGRQNTATTPAPHKTIVCRTCELFLFMFMIHGLTLLVPCRRVHHYDEGFGSWHASRVEPFGWYVNLNGSGLDSGPQNRPKLDEWWDDAGRGSYATSWLYYIDSWRETFLTHEPDRAFGWHSNSWRIQPCSQDKLIWLAHESPGYNVLNASSAGGWANYTAAWTGNTEYPSRRFSTWLESPHYQGCYLTPGSVPIHRPPEKFDRLDGFPSTRVPSGYLPPGEQDQALAGLLDGYRATYNDAASLPCQFPSLPLAKLVDELVFIPELQEL
jgi:hypothetical protein